MVHVVHGEGTHQARADKTIDNKIIFLLRNAK